jgi:hypothetical protein
LRDSVSERSPSTTPWPITRTPARC